jgi:hypothetical protein
MTNRFTRLSDASLLQHLSDLAARDRRTTAELIECIIEVKARRLYRVEGYPSMYRYCMARLGMSADVAFKRMRVAYWARRFPRIIDALADGRLNVAGIVLLSTRLRQDNGDELLITAENKTNKEIQKLLAMRFPQPDVPTVLRPIAAIEKLAARPVSDISNTSALMSATAETASAPIVFDTPKPAQLRPLAPQRLALQVTVGVEMEDLLREAHELLGHPTPTSHIAEVLETAMRLYVEKLRKQKFGATDAPRPARERSPDSRYVPHEVRRAVWNRDGGRCTFVSCDGHRCEERSGLEFDHIRPFAIGGDSSASNVRLLCSTHNQYEAERTYGADFMSHKRVRAAS